MHWAAPPGRSSTATTSSYSKIDVTKTTKILLIAFLLLVAYVAFGNRLFYKVWQEEKTLTELETQVKQLKTETDSLRHVLKLLESDIDFIEKVAREDLGLVKPGEVVIPLPKEEGD